MTNEIWRLNSDWLCAYTEDRSIWRKIKRSYPAFQIHAEYYRDEKRFAIIYRVPSEKRRTITRMLGVPVSR
jgi:hypothetical protein